jgi:hypothetical protein
MLSEYFIFNVVSDVSLRLHLGCATPSATEYLDWQGWSSLVPHKFLNISERTHALSAERRGLERGLEQCRFLSPHDALAR